MFDFKTRPASQSTQGLLGVAEMQLLKPWALLERLRPLKLETVIRQLRDYDRTRQGLQLIEKHFPAALKVYPNLATVEWYAVLHHLATLAEEAEWFEVDWLLLNEAWSWWQAGLYGLDDEDNGDRLATFLYHIPLKLYGFTGGESLFDSPPMELMHALLAECDFGAASSQMLIEAELYDSLDDWEQSDREAAWDRLYDIEADPGRYPEALRRLPELARWACHCTGNLILDQHFDPDGNGPWYTWENDLCTIRAAWQRARPLIKYFNRLMEWSEDAANLSLLANFLIGDPDYEQLDW